MKGSGLELTVWGQVLNLSAGAALVLAAAGFVDVHAEQNQPTPVPPVILFTVSPRAVEYQLSRLTVDELLRVERSTNDPKYRPVYLAVLTRRGMAAAARHEALAALVTMDRTSVVRVLIEALGKVASDDDATAERLVSSLLSQPVTLLKQERATLAAAADAPLAPIVLRGAYPALMLAEEPTPAIWQRASGQPATLVELLKGVSRLPAGSVANPIRDGLAAPILSVLDTTRDAALRAAAVDALVSVRPDAASYARVASEITPTADPQVVTAAIRALMRLPGSLRPQGPPLEALARSVMAVIQATPPARRTQPATTDAIHFADSLSAALPETSRPAFRRELRALGVQVVRMGTIAEQMLYDVRWFVVEAGKPVQLVFSNVEAMPHNVVIGRPGSLMEISTLGAAMPLPADPAAKAYVPNTPLVLWSTRLLKEGETERINFTAPPTPGEYIFVCTFPGHATRMYGVMLVVPDRDAWEAKPVVPIDPMTKSPFTSDRH